MSEVSLATATSPQDIEAVKELVVEYAKTLPFDLGYQDFDGELASFPGKYAPPKGCVLFARVLGEAAGSVALRPLEDNIGEVKRLYVRPGFRGYGLGRRLVGDIVAFARAAGYASLRLDTIRGLMADAENLYQSVGFRECAAYYENPIEGAVYYELNFPQEPGRD